MSANPFAQFQQTQAAAPAAPVASPFGAAPAAASPQGFGPPPVAVQPAGAPAAAQAPVAGGFGLGLPSIGDVSEGGGRLPDVPEGVHLLVFDQNIIKTRKGHAVHFNFTIETTSNEVYPPGSKVVARQSINADVDKRSVGLGAVLSVVRGLAGFADEASFKASPNANAYFQGALAGQPLPFAGRKVYCRGTRGDQMTDPKTGALVPGKFWIRYEWAPVA